MNSFVYGPVPSRRLGRSLGVDIVPFKVCTYDCIYCQLGRTTQKTLDRGALVPAGQVVQELEGILGRVPRPDYVTISGSGEPTLHVELGRLTAQIKRITDVPLAIITNGSLLFRPEVREACRTADLVIPSLDAGDESAFQYVNRPHPSLQFQEVVQGLVQFRKEYEGEIWLEILLLGGFTATAREVSKIKKHTDRIQPDRIQLNTVVRPAAEEFALPARREELKQLREVFGEGAEVIASFPGRGRTKQFEARCEEILSLVSRRPCSIEDIANGLMLQKNQLIKCLDDLVSQGLIKHTYRNGQVYFIRDKE